MMIQGIQGEGVRLKKRVKDSSRRRGLENQCTCKENGLVLVSRRCREHCFGPAMSPVRCEGQLECEGVFEACNTYIIFSVLLFLSSLLVYG